MSEKASFMFQYAIAWPMTSIIEDTGLITENEAYTLWAKYEDDFIDKLREGRRPHMGIWKDCKSTTNYHCIEREWDCRDLYIENDYLYKKEMLRKI